MLPHDDNTRILDPTFEPVGILLLQTSGEQKGTGIIDKNVINENVGFKVDITYTFLVLENVDKCITDNGGWVKSVSVYYDDLNPNAMVNMCLLITKTSSKASASHTTVRQFFLTLHLPKTLRRHARLKS